jgi:hypothetical protein
LLWALLWCVGTPAQAQTPWDGADVAVYVSKKNLSLHAGWHAHLAAFVQSADSLQLSEESLRLATTAQVGNFLAQQVQASGAARGWNLSAQPEEARAFLRLHVPGSPLPVKEVVRLLPRTQWLLTVDSLRFDVATRRSFVVISNRIVEDSKQVRTLVMHVRLLHLPSGKQAAQSVYWEAPQEHQNLLFLPRVDFSPSLAAQVLNWLTDQALLRLFMQVTG